MTEPINYEKTYESFEQETRSLVVEQKKPSKKTDKVDSSSDEGSIFFDFRRGSDCWPSRAELIDPEKGEILIDQAVKEALKSLETAKETQESTAVQEETFEMEWEGDDIDPKQAEIVEESDDKSDLHPDVTFEVLNDGSTALIVKKGYRLKLDLSDLVPSAPEFGGYGGKLFAAKKKKVIEFINEYTITMDIKIIDDQHPDISLFQTALVHTKGVKLSEQPAVATDPIEQVVGETPTEETKKGDKVELNKSMGECVINQVGGLGMFGTFGDTTKARIQPGMWKRIVVAVKCGNPKGEMRTWVGTKPGVVLTEESFDEKGRFAINPEALYIFSSSETSMMPGNIAVRTIRVERTFANDEFVMKNQSRDKVLSIFNEERRKDIDNLRKGLTLAKFFVKPRPFWADPIFIATFGDKFIERTPLEGSSSFLRSFAILNYSLEQALLQSPLLSTDVGMNGETRGRISDVLYVMQKSQQIFDMLLRVTDKGPLITFLKKLKKIIQAVDVGEALLLPVYVEGAESVMLLERKSERTYGVVIVQTSALEGLSYHAASGGSQMPDITYRTCLELGDVPKKNIFDDVFWMALYNMRIAPTSADRSKFYDILLPFLTGRPLENSLIDAERRAHEQGVDAAAAWRAPQCSRTAYVRLYFESLRYTLRRRGVTKLQADTVEVAVGMQMIEFAKNDITYALPDDSGVRACTLALRELSRRVVELVDEASAVGAPFDITGSLAEVNQVVNVMEEKLSSCRALVADLQPQLDLSEPTPEETRHPGLMQYRDMLAWDVVQREPDIGQTVPIGKYTPIDLLQIPKKATTREEAVTAIRLCDRLCSLLDNQPHCVKNDKFLIVATIEHVFTQVIPVPRPRGVNLSTGDLHRSTRAARRAEEKRKEADAEAAELSEKQGSLKKKKKRIVAPATTDEPSSTDETKDAEVAEEDDDDDDGYFDAVYDDAEDDDKEAEESKDPIIRAREAAAKETNTSLDFYGGQEVLPDLTVGEKAERDFVQQSCMWDLPITRGLQVELLQTLQRVTEHFVAAAMSIQQSRPFDGVCIVVTGCLSALADALIRKITTDEPSEACSHLMGRTISGRQLGYPGFGISISSFATQSETIEAHTAELSVARTAVIDYFQSPAQNRLDKIFEWENGLRPTVTLVKYLRMISKEIALASGSPHTFLCDGLPPTSNLMKNYPELQHFRDIVYWWKYLLNPDRKIFPNYCGPGDTRDIPRFDRMSAQLAFQWTGVAYQVTGFGGSALNCKPVVPENTPPPIHRFPSYATPEFFIPAPAVRTEDDVIYRPTLPDFSDSHGQILNQRDSELLFSYLTVPYIRLPLLLAFFSSEDRVHKLQSPQLRNILDSVLFEPGKYLAMGMTGVAPTMVPSNNPKLLATPYGLLMNDLLSSPDLVVRAVMSILTGALSCDTGTVVDESTAYFNTSSVIILYAVRLAARVDNYISFLINWATGTHDCIDWPLREVDIPEHLLVKLQSARISLRDLMTNSFSVLLEDYLKKLDNELTKNPDNDTLLDRNSRLACDLHSHKLLLHRNYNESEMSPEVAKTLVGSFVYLTTRHTWNKATAEGARLCMPETELYELLQVQRRRLVRYLGKQRQGYLDEIMQTAFQVSSSLTGSGRVHAGAIDPTNRWSRIAGERSVGRWAVGSTRTMAAGEDGGVTESKGGEDTEDDDEPPPSIAMRKQPSSKNIPGTTEDTEDLGVEIDVQIGQMTLRAKHLQALPSEVANQPEVRALFGDSTIQVSITERSTNRIVYQLVGRNHEIVHWTSPESSPPPLPEGWEREYDPAELASSESWIVNLFEPVRESFYVPPAVPAPLVFYLPESPLPESAEVAVLQGVTKLIYIFRRLQCVQVYDIISHGKEYWYSLNLTTDHRYALRELQPSAADRMVQYPDWWIRGCVVGPESSQSILIIRDQQHNLNLSGGKELFLSPRFLYGLIPHALLDAYSFWRSEGLAPVGTPVEQLHKYRGYQRLLGYPNDTEGEFMIIVEILYTEKSETVRDENYVDPAYGYLVQCTSRPGRTVKVTRRPRLLFTADFQQRQQIAATIESFAMLHQQNAKKCSKKKEEKTKKTTSEMFKVGASVECDYEGKGEFWPCKVARANDDGTYNLEYEDTYKWLGLQKGVDAERVQRRGIYEEKKRKEAATESTYEWHYDGMSDSEEDDWREDERDDDDDDIDDEAALTKSRLSFHHFDGLGSLIDVANGDLVLCKAAITHLGTRSFKFSELHDLAVAMKDIISKSSEGSLLARSASSDELAKVIDAEDMYLLNLLYAPRSSRLCSILRVLVRIENASHILGWTHSGRGRGGPRMAFGCASVDFVELPRLKLAFTARNDHQHVLRLYSVDHMDLFISNDINNMTATMLDGIPHSLVLSNVRGETQVLVPVIPAVRPNISNEPFSTFVVLDRTRIPHAERFFLYPVHVSVSFLLTKGINSAMYLMLLRFLHRDYAQVFRLADGVATDTKLNAEGQVIFNNLSAAGNDCHPDAHACRMKISLVVADSDMSLPWTLTAECSRHAVKLDSVSSNCRMAPAEELQLLESGRVQLVPLTPTYSDHYSSALCFNRQQMLRAQVFGSTAESGGLGDGTTEISCHVPPRALTSNWPFYADNTVFGESYEGMREVSSASEGEHSWLTEVKGGDEIDAPSGGWLVVVYFYTLWSSSSAVIMTSLEEIMPVYQSHASFLSVRADGEGMVKISKSLTVKHFPSIVFMRGGVEVGRIEGADKMIENFVTKIKELVTAEDKVSHAKRRERIRREKAALTGQVEEEQEEHGALEWTWDQCGPAMAIEEEGMRVIMPGEEDDSGTKWEWNASGAYFGWTPFTKEESDELERKYCEGTIFQWQYLNWGYMYANSIEISDFEVKGFNGCFNKDGKNVAIRRSGDRLSVPGEEGYLSERQKARDARLVNWWKNRDVQIQREKDEKYGQDIEVVRGSVAIIQNTGIVEWTLRWEHEPARGGQGDSIGLCSDGLESFDAGPHPRLGGTSDSGASLALSASGELYHNGSVLNFIAGSRIPPEGLSTDAAKDFSPLFGEGSLVTCHFDTGLDGGTLSFSIDSKPLEVAVKNVFSLLGGDELYPCMALCPLIDPPKSLLEGKEIPCEGAEETKGEEAGADQEAAKPEEEVKVRSGALIPTVTLLPPPTPEGTAAVEVTFTAGCKVRIKRMSDAAAEAAMQEAGLYWDAANMPACLGTGAYVVDVNGDVSCTLEMEDGTSATKGTFAWSVKMLDFISPPIKTSEATGQEPIEMVRWMYQRDDQSWKCYTKEISKELEEARRAGETAHKLVYQGQSYKLSLDSMTFQAQAGGNTLRLRRHVMTGAVDDLWSMLSVKYERPNSLSGESAVSMLQNFWGSPENMCGDALKLGFIFLYSLMSGDAKCTICTASYGGKFGGGGFKGGNGGFGGGFGGGGFGQAFNQDDDDGESGGWGAFGGDGEFTFGGKTISVGGSKKSTNDAHRFGVLLSQLISDKTLKSVMGSVINVIARNRQVALRLPKFKDTRKSTKSQPVFNGWVDDSEARSPVAELFARLVPMVAAMKRKGALHFPPLPPHEELPTPANTVSVMSSVVDVAHVSTPALGSSTATVAIKLREWERPDISDYACGSRNIAPVLATVIADMARDVNFRFASDQLVPVPPINVENEEHFNLLSEQFESMLVVVFFHATWCHPCKVLSPIYHQLAMATPTARFLKVDIDKCELLAPHFGIRTTPTVLFLRKIVNTTEPGSKVDLLTSMMQYRTAVETSREERRLLIVQFFRPRNSPLAEAATPVLDTLADQNACLRVVRVDISTALGRQLLMDTNILESASEEDDEDPEHQIDGAVVFWRGPKIVERLGGPNLIDLLNAAVAKHLPLASAAVSKLSSSRKKAAFVQHSVRGGIEGAKPDFITMFSTYVDRCSTEDELSKLSIYRANAPCDAMSAVVVNMASSESQTDVLATQPLLDCSQFVVKMKRQDLDLPLVNPDLAFDVSPHEAAMTAPAVSVLNRFKEDVSVYAETANTADIMKMVKISEKDIAGFFAGDARAESILQEGFALVKDLLKVLHQLRDSDSEMVQNTVSLMEKVANRVPLSLDDSEDTVNSKTRFVLRRYSGQHSFVWIEFLFGSLLSSCGERDLLELNPFMPGSTVSSVFNIVAVTMLRANRLGHTNRCIGIVVSLEGLLQKILAIPVSQRLGLEATMTPKLIQNGEDAAKTITAGRHFMRAEAPGQYTFDPRYLVFEFVWNIQLRKKQVAIVDDFRENLSQGRSKVKQMIMGAGKTSVVAPLLALILADGKSLVLSVVPKALVEMSRKNMRETFAAVMVKRIYTLEFSRSTVAKPSIRRSLENAAASRGVVVATPTTLKSMMLSYVEALQNIKEAQTSGNRANLPSYQLQATELQKTLALFREGIMLLDEVDLILHPLKSELNFPIGEKFDLDGATEGERWNLPIHLLDAVFYVQIGTVSTFEQRGAAKEILSRIASAVQQGIDCKSIQRLPHVTLLNVDFYDRELKPLMAEWAYLWLQKQHLHGIDRVEAVQYMLEGATARSETSTRINFIETAITKARVKCGLAKAGTPRTRAYEQSLSEKQKADEELRTKAIAAEPLDEPARAFLMAQISALTVSRNSAMEHRRIITEIYDIDEQIEAQVREEGRILGEIDGEIIQLHKKLGELECPRDDSLDNSIVIWVSDAFKPVTATSSPNAADNVSSVCTILEDSGLTVRRFHDVEEAVGKARELQERGYLRCVILGGDERASGCPSFCSDSHYGTLCLICNSDYNNHNGHNCVVSTFCGKRGSFPQSAGPTRYPGAMEAVSALCVSPSINNTTKKPFEPLPANRVAVFATAVYEEHERQLFWTFDISVIEEPKALAAFVNTIRGWNDTVSGDTAGGDSAADASTLVSTAAIAADLASTFEEKSIEEKKLLDKYRSEIEALEARKATLVEDSDAARSSLRAAAGDKNKELEAAVTRDIFELEAAQATFDKLLAAINAERDEINKYNIGASNARDAAIAEAWLASNHSLVDAVIAGSPDFDDQFRAAVKEHAIGVTYELAFLRHMALAAKVVALVISPMHKKLLNLCSNWINTYLPHCLGKVNRVSFGLLSTEDCAVALAEDPYVPRSRLKLAVPFVGKDVPSKAAEFAHPDIIIGLTILAYRYSGLRREDFTDVMDSTTSQFTLEIGPARDRESSKRHENWVFAAGGSVRGFSTTFDGRTWVTPTDDSGDKEVVQLRYLQKSNEEQMEKLYNLVSHEPLAIHHYLQKTIFPKYTPSQRVKISASGQAVGGDMLVGKRVGFSGTPSDLLPEELGRCDYETGDDGMMLTTVLDRRVASYELLPDKWTVELLLERIATANNPRVNALIDTGALITGYSNVEVARKLLELGLSWCEGVIFLDDEDRQQVLVKATGRVVSADQCGVSLEKRFAFYDQIHTTGMDIKHVVNATAVITLGKDMVFRDYVQGAYRMRGIGAGQKIHVYIIPEVQETMHRELRNCAVRSDDPNDHVLEDIVAWLVINSLRSEQTQWTMLVLQNIGNLYRKNAFKCIHNRADKFIKPSEDGIASEESAADLPAALRDDPFVAALDREKALKVFDEPIDFSLESSVPDPLAFEDRLRGMLDAHEVFLKPEQHSIGHSIMETIHQFANIQKSANRLDSEQEREQEQEQEKEMEARRDQEIEIEKFVEMEYSRQDEAQRPWPFSILSRPADSATDHPFYPLKDFHLRHHEPLRFSDSLLVSANYFNPKWSGLRRLKNVIMVLEFAPDAAEGALRLKTEQEAAVTLTEAQLLALQKAHALLGTAATAAGHPRHLNAADVTSAIHAATDELPSPELVESILHRFADAGSGSLISFSGFQDMITKGALYPEHKGRFWVAVSLSEAETIRRILHVRCKHEQALIPGATTEINLRYSPVLQPAGVGSMIFDSSLKWRLEGSGATHYEAAVAHSSFRFYDGDMHFSAPAVFVLIRVLMASTRDRERFFQSTVGVKRRMETKWQDTPLAKVFTIADEFIALKQRAQAVFVTDALRAKAMTLWEFFIAIDCDDNGSLSPSEFYGALKWLQMPELTVEDTADFIDSIDINRDGLVSYAEYMDMLAPWDPRENASDHEAVAEEGAVEALLALTNDSKPLNKIEPYGAEEIRQEVVRRKQVDRIKDREERLRRQVYKEQLEVKIFEEELEASKRRRGGANPNVRFVGGAKKKQQQQEEDSTVATSVTQQLCVTDFKFFHNSSPLRFVGTGKYSLQPYFLNTAQEPKAKPICCPRGHTLTAYTAYSYCSICRSNYPCYLMCTAGECYYTYFVCPGCNDAYTKKEEDRLKVTGTQPTFLRCETYCSFAVQIPPAGGADPETGDYSVTVELRLEKLPPVDQLQSLLRFTVADIAQPLKLHSVNVLLDSHGIAGRGLSHSAPLPVSNTAAAAASAASMAAVVVGEVTVESSPGSPAAVAAPRKNLFGEGARVQANFKSTGNFNAGQISKVGEDGKYDIAYDNGEVEEGVPEAAIRLEPLASIDVGSRVEVNYHDLGLWYVGVVEKLCGGPYAGVTYSIAYDNGVKENRVPKSRIRGNSFVPTEGPVVLEDLTLGGAAPSRPSALRAGVWSTITAVVSPARGSLLTYIDGKLCQSFEGLDPADLRLQHKLTVLGGGKQALNRGGDVRRVVIHSRCLPAEAVQVVHYKLVGNNPLVLRPLIKLQACVRGYICRNEKRSAEPPGWSCAACTLINKGSDSVCAACETPK